MTDGLGFGTRDITVRRAAPHDVSALVSVINAAYRVEDFFIVGDRTDAHDVGEHLAQGEFLVAEREHSAIQGCVYVRSSGERGYFGMLAVAPAGQGVGLGRLLVERAEQRAASGGAAHMDLVVANLRTELPSWYERLGYVRNGTEPFAAPAKLKRSAHFIKMSKDLASRSAL